MNAIDEVTTDVFRFPTTHPESDGTLTWDATTAVTVSIAAGHERGLGWTYTSPAAAIIIEQHLAPLLRGSSPDDITDTWLRMRKACRNLGVTGVVAHALSAVDIALWDLKTRLLQVPLSAWFGKVREAAAVYGSGGFVNLTDDQLSEQVIGWEVAGCTAVKIKIGAEPERDVDRIALVHKLVGSRTQVMVDANGAYTPDEARRVGAELDRLGVVWFEEPVTSDDPDGLRRVRDAVHCTVAAGEYIYTETDATRLIDAVDCLQLDLTRCGGYTGFHRAAVLAAAHHRDISTHGSPALHAGVATAVRRLRHLEWFTDHTELESLLVDGAPHVIDGRIGPRGTDADPYGHGMRLAASAAAYRISPAPLA
ncbi:enolase C-terminal domain-like protein [Nocardia sp. NBC_00511]|uniref:enolase C-terminal domain-like protein n=1 Tax=Nocardia sp. NBC_00511 TaxID=2903591 RepID=UPI0030DE16C0